MKGAIYYTDFSVDLAIMKVCQEKIKESFNGKIVSVSLNRSLNFGKNIVIKGERGYIMMIRQIITALENLTTKYVFFLEHDVLYSSSHFDFIPLRDDIFYYNSNVWKWKYGDNKVITYDRMLPLSCLCVNRQFTLEHYKRRYKKIQENLDKFNGREPELGRKWGYEPGTKKKKRGGFSNDDFEIWQSKDPIIDIRHNKTFSNPKCTLDSFKHIPLNWKEISIKQLGVDLKMFL